LFLKTLYTEWRLLFYAVILFILAQTFFVYKGIENIPFFLYYMYGQTHPKKDSINIVLIKTKEGYFNPKKLSGREQEMLLNSVDYYVSLKKRGDGNKINIANRFSSISTRNYFEKMLCNDSAALKKFPQWWLSYYTQVVNPLGDSVTIVKSTVSTTYPYSKSSTDSVIFSLKVN
jgi:hypothetical protein